MKKYLLTLALICSTQQAFAEFSNLEKFDGVPLVSRVVQTRTSEDYSPANVLIGTQYLKKEINNKTICITDERFIARVDKYPFSLEKEYGLAHIEIHRNLSKCSKQRKYIQISDDEPIIRNGAYIYSFKSSQFNPTTETRTQDTRFMYSGVDIYNKNGDCHKELVTYLILDSGDYNEIGEKDYKMKDYKCSK